jgi:hypothetical protein
VTGGRQVAEKVDGASGEGFTVSYDLGMNERTGFVNQISALDVEGTSVYVGFCGVCDIITLGNNDPATFQNGIATNVEPGCEAKPMTDACWHFAEAEGLPNRYITDIAISPTDPSTIYVTVGGYGRRWFLPADDAPGVGEGHVFVSTDRGETFTNLSGTGAQRLPDVPADAVLVRDDRLVVGTDVGVFTSTLQGQRWERLGAGLPNVSAFDVNLDPAGQKMVVATHGRGVWTYDFGAPMQAPPVPQPGSVGGPPPAAAPGGTGAGGTAAPGRVLGTLPATGGLPLAALGVGLLTAAWVVRRRSA